MIPVQALQDQAYTLLAADATWLAPAVSANKVHLFVNPAVPSPQSVLGDFTEAAYTGYVALAGTTGTQTTYIDPLTQDRTILIDPPLGGWYFPCTVTPGAPVTVYGYYVTDNAGAVLIGSGLLLTPEVINLASQAVLLPDVLIQLPPAIAINQ